MPLFWIIRQPNCEIATALQLFYICEPYEFIEMILEGAPVPKLQRNEFALFSEIRERLVAGFYTRATIAFDGDKAFRQYFGDIPTDTRAFDLIPEPLRQTISGRVLPDASNTFRDGFPDAIWA